MEITLFTNAFENTCQLLLLDQCIDYLKSQNVKPLGHHKRIVELEDKRKRLMEELLKEAEA